MLKLYNTLTKKIEEIPKKDHLNLYTCGPTAYNYAHIGNMRSYIFEDLLYRALKYEGYNPKWVMNITDIDDKTIKAAIAKYGKGATVENLREITKFYFDEFLRDLGEVNVLKDEIEFIRVTDVIPEIQKFIIALMDKGYAYKAEDGIYFSIEKYQKDFGDYGQLVGEKFLEGKKVGARVAVDEYEKENLSDFALWKTHNASTDGNIYWEHPELGNGRPGWHIECSVINQVAFKGQPTDIHTGGVDLIFPHHTNEIAQSQALAGKGNFVRHWFHSEHLLVDGKKMAKSVGNFKLFKDIRLNEDSGYALRLLFLQSNYDGQQNFTHEAFRSAHHRLRHLQVLAKIETEHIADIQNLKKIESEIFDNLNLPIALGFISKDFPESKAVTALIKLNDIFGLNLFTPEEIPSAVVDLKNQRVEAKKQKDFTKSDELRKQIEDLGYEVMDTPDGQKVKKKLKI